MGLAPRYWLIDAILALLPEVVASPADADSFSLLRFKGIGAFLSKFSRLACTDAAIESIAEIGKAPRAFARRALN
jgi:hypothetical protein